MQQEQQKKKEAQQKPLNRVQRIGADMLKVTLDFDIEKRDHFDSHPRDQLSEKGSILLLSFCLPHALLDQAERLLSYRYLGGGIRG